MAKESAARTGSWRKKENFVAKKRKHADDNILIYFTFALIKSIILSQRLFCEYTLYYTNNKTKAPIL